MVILVVGYANVVVTEAVIKRVLNVNVCMAMVVPTARNLVPELVFAMTTYVVVMVNVLTMRPVCALAMYELVTGTVATALCALMDTQGRLAL